MLLHYYSLLGLSRSTTPHSLAVCGRQAQSLSLIMSAGSKRGRLDRCTFLGYPDVGAVRRSPDKVRSLRAMGAECRSTPPVDVGGNQDAGSIGDVSTIRPGRVPTLVGRFYSRDAADGHRLARELT